jgi:hypothetical protein
MSIRYNETNSAGILTISGGNMPASTYTNKYQPLSRTQGQGGAGGAATITVTSGPNAGHAVEVDGDGGLYDTVSGANVQDWQTNILCIGT